METIPCCKENQFLFSHSREVRINFLAEKFDKGSGYVALHTARSSLSLVIVFGTNPIVCRFLLKELFTVDPPYQGE